MIYIKIRRLLLQSKNLFFIQLVWVIWFLIKNKGHFKIDMQSDSFDNNYYVDRDNEDNYIKTNIFNRIIFRYFRHFNSAIINNTY